MRPKDIAIAAVVALVIGTLLYLNLDSGRMSSERAARLVSLPLGGLALIFGVRTWTESQSPDARWTGLFAGLSIGVGGYALVRLVVF